MKFKLAPLLAAASALLAATHADAVSYSTSYVADATSASSGGVSGSGDIGAALLVGDSLTITFSAPTGLSFLTAGGSLFDYQFQIGGGSLTEDVTYAFYSGSTVLDSGSVTGAGACCVDLRLPVYNSPVGTWDHLVYTLTLTSESGPAVLQDLFSYSQQDAVYVSSVPEASNAAMLLAGLGLFGIAARRRKA